MWAWQWSLISYFCSVKPCLFIFNHFREFYRIDLCVLLTLLTCSQTNAWELPFCICLPCKTYTTLRIRTTSKCPEPKKTMKKGCRQTPARIWNCKEVVGIRNKHPPKKWCILRNLREKKQKRVDFRSAVSKYQKSTHRNWSDLNIQFVGLARPPFFKKEKQFGTIFRARDQFF